MRKIAPILEGLASKRNNVLESPYLAHKGHALRKWKVSSEGKDEIKIKHLKSGFSLVIDIKNRKEIPEAMDKILDLDIPNQEKDEILDYLDEIYDMVAESYGFETYGSFTKKLPRWDINQKDSFIFMKNLRTGEVFSLNLEEENAIPKAMHTFINKTPLNAEEMSQILNFLDNMFDVVSNKDGEQ